MSLSWVIHPAVVIFIRCQGQTEKTRGKKEGGIMAGYTVTALALDQNEPTSRFTVAVSVMDSNGLGIQNLSESNFTILTITRDTSVAVAEIQSLGLPGFYRLLLKAEPVKNAGNQILILVVTSHHHIVGRVPEGKDRGHTMVKVRLG
jgi:hypothetical protein